jgi:hypothetical protein
MIDWPTLLVLGALVVLAPPVWLFLWTRLRRTPLAASDRDLLGLVFERLGELVDAMHGVRTEVVDLRKDHAEHVKDDERRFARLRLADRELAEDITDAGGRRAALTNPEIVTITETERTKRWKIAAGAMGVIATALGGVLAGRAMAAPAPPPPSVPYAVPATGNANPR